jgi:ADP-ribose pyrophosphatase
VHVGRKIRVALDTETLPDGQTIRRDIVLHPGAVAIIPLIDRDHVCLLQNVRPAVEAELWEIPAGTLEPDEPPAEAAVRELAEETGYLAGRLTKLAELIPSPGVLSEVIHLYLAEDLTPGPMSLEADEELTPHVIPWSQAMTWATDGTIRDAKTLVALLLLDRRRGS